MSRRIHWMMGLSGVAIWVGMGVWVQARENAATLERVDGPRVERVENPPIDPPTAPAYVVAAGRSPLAQEGENLRKPFALVIERAPTTATAARDSSAPAATGPVISWQEAGQHIGKTMTVEGRIVDTFLHTSSQNTFLNFSKTRAGNFYVIMFREMLDQFPEPPDQFFRNKNVRVTGRISERDGRPQIQVRNKDQIVVVE